LVVVVVVVVIVGSLIYLEIKLNAAEPPSFSGLEEGRARDDCDLTT